MGIESIIKAAESFATKTFAKPSRLISVKKEGEEWLVLVETVVEDEEMRKYARMAIIGLWEIHLDSESNVTFFERKGLKNATALHYDFEDKSKVGAKNTTNLRLLQEKRQRSFRSSLGTIHLPGVHRYWYRRGQETFQKMCILRGDRSVSEYPLDLYRLRGQRVCHYSGRIYPFVRSAAEPGLSLKASCLA